MGDSFTFTFPRFERAEPAEGSKPCEQCGGAFLPKRSTAKYCSAACRQANHAGRGGRITDQCLHCDGPMFGTRADALYCSRRCAAAWRRGVEAQARDYFTEVLGEDGYADLLAELGDMTPGQAFASEAVREVSPELVRLVEAGHMSLWDAYRSVMP